MKKPAIVDGCVKSIMAKNPDFKDHVSAAFINRIVRDAKLAGGRGTKDLKPLLIDQIQSRLGHIKTQLQVIRDEVTKQPVESAKPNPESTAEIEDVKRHTLEVAKREIEADIASGDVPQDVRSFSELQDYVDANLYVNDSDRDDRRIGPLGKKLGWGVQEYIDFTSDVIAEIDKWLAGRTGLKSANKKPSPPTTQDETKIPETSSPAPVESQPPVTPAAEEAQVGASQRQGAGEEVTKSDALNNAANFAVPPIVSGMLNAGIKAGRDLTNRVSNVKQAPYESGQEFEVITFDLDGKKYQAELKGRNQGLTPGINPEADKGIAARTLLSGDAKEIGPSDSGGRSTPGDPKELDNRDAAAKKALAYTSGKGTIGNLTGGSLAERRAELLSTLTGTKVPKAKAGINAVMKAFYEAFNIQQDTIAGMEKALANAIIQSQSPTKQQPPPTIQAKEQVDEGRGAISPEPSPRTPKQGRPTVAKVDVAESPKPDTKSSEQKKLEAQLQKVDEDIFNATEDGDEVGADRLRVAKKRIESRLEELTQSLPASTIKQGDTIQFKQEGQTLSGTYIGPVKSGDSSIYEVQVAGEAKPRRVSAKSINDSNDAQLDGTKFSRQRTTRPKTQGLERSVAEKHLKKLGVPSTKVYLVDEPSFKWRGRYDPDGGIGLNLAYLNSVEELNDTLMRHEAVHDAVETDQKVKQRAIELLDALTPDELSIINEQIQGYSENEMQDEQIVEAVRLMTSRRPDLRTKWARFVEAVSLAIKKFLGIKNLDRQVAELVAARILARGEARVLKGKMGGRDKFSGNMYSGDAKDSEYLAAVEAGDMEKAQRMVDQAAKDEGLSGRLQHWTNAKSFTIFDPSRIGSANGLSGTQAKGFWFNDSSGTKSPFGSRKIDAFLILRNPRIFESAESYDSTTEEFDSSESFTSSLISQGYDGIIIRPAEEWMGSQEWEFTNYVAFNPSQIKSADPVTYDSDGNVIPLSQRFQSESPDIRYSRVPTQGEPTTTESVLNEAAANRAERLKAEESMSKEEKLTPRKRRKQVMGVEDLGPKYMQQALKDAIPAAKAVFDGDAETLDAAGLERWRRVMDQYSVSTAGSGARVLSLIEAGNDMSPTALQTELGKYAERYTDLTEDPSVFKEFVNEVNDLMTVIGGITSASRNMAARRWSPLTERWGAYLKVSKDIEQNGPPNIDKIKKIAKEEALDNIDDKAPKDSTIKRLLAKAKGDVTWGEFFTENPRDKQKDRQREIYIKILGSDKFKDLSKEERLELTRVLDKIWRQEHGRVFLREFEKKIPLKNPKLKKQLAAKAPALLKAINLGTFDSEAYRKEIAQTYGLKDLSDADLVKVIKLGAEIQNEPVESLARRRKIMQLADLVSGVTNIPRSHILASYYISSLLASARTGVGAAFSFVEVLMESFMGVIASGVKSPTQALNGLNAAIRAFPRGVLEGLSHFYTGDKTGTLLASDSFNQYLGGEGYSPVSLGSLLWKEKNPVKKFAGAVIMAAERMLTGIDLALSSTLHEASLVWANSATEFKDANGNIISIRNPTAADKQRMRDQVIAEEFGGVEPPKTLPNLAKINAGMRDQIERFYINEAPDAGMDLVKTGRRVASGPSFQGEVRGAMGFVVNRVNTFFGDASEQFEKWADKKGITGVERQIYAMGVGLLSLGKSFAGMQFFSFVGRLINRNLQFVPGSALLPRVILGSDPTSYEKKIMQIKNAFGLGLIMAAISYITDDDDDEDKLFGLEGDWSSLSGDQRDAKRTAKALPSSFWYKDQDGNRQYLSFANSSLSWIFSAVANLRELKVNNPEKWNEASEASIAAGGIYEAFKSVLNTSAMGRLGELLGGGRASKPGDVGTGAEQFASKVASFGGGFVPSIIRELDYMMDPGYYEPKTLAERAVSVIPFLRRQVADSQGSLGVLGTPAQINRSPTSRVYSSGADTEAEKILARMADEGLYLPLPDDKKGRDYVSPVSGRKIQMTKPQIQEYVRLVGEDYSRFILRDGENLMTMNRDKAKERISDAASKIKTRAARMAMRIQEPTP